MESTSDIGRNDTRGVEDGHLGHGIPHVSLSHESPFGVQ